MSNALVTRAREGPWVEDIAPVDHGRSIAGFAATEVDIAAHAPIRMGDDLVGLLSLGVAREGRRPTATRRSGLLAEAIDYANILSVVVGPALAERRDVATVRARLETALSARAFHPVFQPIVELESRTIVGYEALTRFDDGTRPDLRFAEAEAVGLGLDFEEATLEAALRAERMLPSEAFLSLNVSPAFVVGRGAWLHRLIEASRRRLVIEITEFAQIDDYSALRHALGGLADADVAVDDAGAGYASLHHILELRPRFVKIDLSLIRGIDADDSRQALAAGFAYFALRSDFHLIAEGVETDSEAAALERLGIEFGQGFLFGRPAPISA